MSVLDDNKRAYEECRLMAGKTWMPAAASDAFKRAAVVLEADRKWMEHAARLLVQGKKIVSDFRDIAYHMTGKTPPKAQDETIN